jgi:hypothetical protein
MPARKAAALKILGALLCDAANLRDGIRQFRRNSTVPAGLYREAQRRAYADEIITAVELEIPIHEDKTR